MSPPHQKYPTWQRVHRDLTLESWSLNCGHNHIDYSYITMADIVTYEEFQEEEHKKLLKKYTWCSDRYQKIITQCGQYKKEEKQFDKDIREIAKNSLKD